jgi:Golgi phosphoprotein 3
MISIVEELYLLALDDEKGNIVPIAKKTLAFGLAGAILAELSLQKKVCSNEKHRLELADHTPCGDEILDEALEEIRSSEKPRKLTYWISQFSNRPKKLQERIAESLVTKNVLYQEEKRYFRNQPSQENEQPIIQSKFETKAQLRAMVLSSANADHRSLTLLNLTKANELLNLIFTQDELSLAKNRIHEIIVHSALADQDMQCIEEIGQAVQTSLEDEQD